MRGLVHVTLNALSPAASATELVHARVGAGRLTRSVALSLCRALDALAPESIAASHLTATAVQLLQGLLEDVLGGAEARNGDGSLSLTWLLMGPRADVPAFAQLAICLVARTAEQGLVQPDWLMGAYLAFAAAQQYLEALARASRSNGWVAMLDMPNFLVFHPRIASGLAAHMAGDVSWLAAGIVSPDAGSDCQTAAAMVLPLFRLVYMAPDFGSVTLRRALGERLVPSELVDLVRGLCRAREPSCHDALAILLTYMVRGSDEVGITLLGRGVVEYFVLAFTLDERTVDSATAASLGVLRLVIDLARRPGLRERIRGRLRPLMPTLAMSQMATKDGSGGLKAAGANADVVGLARAFDLPDPTLARDRRKCSFVECTRTSPPMACAGCRLLRFCDRRCAVACVGHSSQSR